MHVEAPITVLKVPAVQVIQTLDVIAPEDVEYNPISQVVHSVTPVDVE
jgi:hypothetical protein